MGGKKGKIHQEDVIENLHAPSNNRFKIHKVTTELKSKIDNPQL